MDVRLDFGFALADVRAGYAITRQGWNAPRQYVVYQPGYPDGIDINANTAKALGLAEGTVVRFREYLLLRTADGSCVPWAPTVTDVLARDWMSIDISGTVTTRPHVVGERGPELPHLKPGAGKA